jgi:hypothetical protein
LAVVAALCYAALRFTFNPPFDATFFQKIYDFIAPVPFGKRVLIAWLARPLVAGGLSISGAYQFWEACSAFALLLGLYRLFGQMVEKPWARLLSVGFVFVCRRFSCCARRFRTCSPGTRGHGVPRVALHFLLQGAWGRALVLTLFAAANRESALLIPLLFGALYVDRLPLPKLVGIGLGLAAAYLAVAGLVSLTLADNLPYYSASPFASFHKHGQWRIFINLDWLTANWRNGWVLLASMGGLPLAFLALVRQIPPPLRRFA